MKSMTTNANAPLDSMEEIAKSLWTIVPIRVHATTMLNVSTKTTTVTNASVNQDSKEEIVSSTLMIAFQIHVPITRRVLTELMHISAYVLQDMMETNVRLNCLRMNLSLDQKHSWKLVPLYPR